jgi:hypothetical protein
LLFEALGDVRVKSAVLSNLGSALTGQGEYSQAKLWLRQSLTMAWELGNREDSIESIEALAGVAGATGDVCAGRCGRERLKCCAKKFNRQWPHAH